MSKNNQTFVIQFVKLCTYIIINVFNSVKTQRNPVYKRVTISRIRKKEKDKTLHE